MKYGKVTLEEVRVAIDKLGGLQVWDAWQRGEKTVTVKDAIQPLFDKHGRRISEYLPADACTVTKVCAVNGNYRLDDQPKLVTVDDFAIRILRLYRCLGDYFQVTAKQFKTETERLLAIIRKNPEVANIVNGVYLPIILPKLVTDDLGAELEFYLTGVNNSYTKTFDKRVFNYKCKGNLTNQVKVVDGSRHDQLIARMKKSSVIGLHFPNPLRGYSVCASREHMSTLPKGFILSGMDTPIAMVMYPDVLARDWNTPGLDMAALQWLTTYGSLSFNASNNGLYLNQTGCLAYAHASFSSGLLFLG
jgi:hypothetical protein